ncbi:MAG: helix-turn-helix transcriptional regulator [Rhodospirillales bacterium]|nr:helix-turn-helix transcriptional regulator [Rhodospirillales bacterium]MBI2978543.1 helix-turn-helix transcriptional regulator [Rhodospirillales bacterium]
MAIYYTHPLDRTFHALGDQSRRKMLAAIRQNGSCSAGELVELFDFAQPTVSKHLRMLELAELIERRVDGRHHVFTLRAQRIEEAEDWLRRHLTFWEKSLDRLGDYLAATPQAPKKS